MDMIYVRFRDQKKEIGEPRLETSGKCLASESDIYTNIYC